MEGFYAATTKLASVFFTNCKSNIGDGSDMKFHEYFFSVETDKLFLDGSKNYMAIEYRELIKVLETGSPV
jgi:hypothetical protein